MGDWSPRGDSPYSPARPIVLRGQRQEFPVHPVSSGDSRPRFHGDHQGDDDTREEAANAPHQLAPQYGSPPQGVKPGCD